MELILHTVYRGENFQLYVCKISSILKFLNQSHYVRSLEYINQSIVQEFESVPFMYRMLWFILLHILFDNINLISKLLYT